MKNMWGERLNKRHIFDWFVFFVTLFFSSIILTAMVIVNWQEINVFVKEKILGMEVTVNNNEETPPNEDTPIETPDLPDSPEEPNNPEDEDQENPTPETPETPQEPTNPETPEEPEEPEEPTEPSEPEQPEDPEEEEPVDPEPETPTEPEEPTEPTEPVVANNLTILLNNADLVLDTSAPTGSTYGKITTTYGENLNLSPADFKVTSSFSDNTTKDLNAEEYTFTSNIPSDALTPAGTYLITFKYATLNEIQIEIIINKANISFTPVWNNSTVTYSGTEQQVEIANLPETLNVTYSGTNKAKAVGEYSTTATFTLKDENNYTFSQGAEQLTWNIEKADLIVTANDKAIRYGDEPENAGYSISGFVGGENETVLSGMISYSYNYSASKKAGNYKITPSGFSASNYNIIYQDGKLTVNKAVVDTSYINSSNIKLKTSTFDYTGYEIKVELQGYSLPVGVKLTSLTNTVATDVGTYACVAIFECSDTTNFESFTPIEISMSWEIKETEYQKLIKRLKALEDLAKAYDSSNWQLNFLSYIRSATYNDSEWTMVAGSPDENFATYVQENQGSYDLTSFKTNTGANSTFTTPSTKEDVDFYHLFAVMNVVYKGGQSGSDLSGWAGDLIQIMSYFKNSTSTGNALIAEIKEHFNARYTYCGFGSLDVCADFDAVNIIKKYKEGGYSSLTECLNDYYKTITTKERIKGFTAETFSGGYSESSILSRLKSNLYIVVLANKYGVTLSDSNEVCTACIKIFKEYLDLGQ